LNILFAASEAVPFCKTGGLADVIGDLPKALAEQFPNSKKPRILTFLPKYAAINAVTHGLKLLPGKIQIPLGEKLEEGRIWNAGDAYFLENNKFYDRPYLYGPGGGDYPDSDERFIFFCRAALEFCKLINFAPDIVHGHDWQTGLVSAYLKTLYKSDALFKKTKSIFTIHNIAYQGSFPKERFPLTGLSPSEFTPDKIEFYGKFSLLKAGLVYSDQITTVSKKYAQEIQGANEFGRGMEGILKTRSKNLRGILNGINEKIWDPAADPHLSGKNKEAWKADLQKTLGFSINAKAPLIGMVSRIDPQKGFDMVMEIFPKLLTGKPNLQIIILGSGDPKIEKSLLLSAARFPGRAAVKTEFNDPLAHKIYAGSDLFLMPSKFEPCGLGQMIAMKYGTPPVVTPTGGLFDSVKNWNVKKGTGNGFVCKETSAASLLQTLGSALKTHELAAPWKCLCGNAAKSDFSWGKSAREYVKLYRE